jgi:Zn-dependent protease
MLRAWKLGTAFGIGIYLHPTILLLPLWVFLSSLPLGGWMQATYTVGLLVPVFACVVLHELGHALMARRFGIATRHITLYPIGGVAQLERMSEKPWEEFWIAVAGPAVNVGIAFLLFWPLALSGILTDAEHVSRYATHRNPLFDLWLVNIGLVVFNLIPAFPMDGGRMLRALLATQLDYVSATRVAVWVATAVAGLLTLAMFLLFHVTGQPFNPILLLIVGFVFLMGRYELWALRQRAARQAEPLDVLPAEESLPVAEPVAVQVFIWDTKLGGWVERGTRRPLSSSWVRLD